MGPSCEGDGRDQAWDPADGKRENRGRGGEVASTPMRVECPTVLCPFKKFLSGPTEVFSFDLEKKVPEEGLF